MDLPFRPPKRSRRSSEYETSQLITAERPVGSRRKLRVSSLPVRIGESLIFLATCVGTAGVVGLFAWMVDSNALPSNGESNILQAFESVVQHFAFSAIGMWLVHLATMLLTNRIHRVRASEGRRTSALAGAIAYPLFLFCVGIGTTLDVANRVVTIVTLIVPAVIATLIAPGIIPNPPAPE